jgi:hypothetical protein
MKRTDKEEEDKLHYNKHRWGWVAGGKMVKCDA